MKNLLTIVFYLFLCTACNYDQVTTEYASYQNAFKAGFFAKGWIPYELQDSSMTDIYVRSNLDVNTYIFSFSTQQGIINMPPASLNQITTPIEIHGIDIPNWWNEGIMNKPRTVFPLGYAEKINLVFDKNNGIIYGWNEKSR